MTIVHVTRNLSTLIKPAAPNPNTTLLIDGNARNWAHTTLLILRGHYTETMESDIEKLTNLSTVDFEEPFQVASDWARQNLGHCLLPETLEYTGAVIAAKLADLSATEEIDDPPATTTPAPSTKLSKQRSRRSGATRGPPPPRPAASATGRSTATLIMAQRATTSQMDPDIWLNTFYCMVGFRSEPL